MSFSQPNTNLVKLTIELYTYESSKVKWSYAFINKPCLSKMECGYQAGVRSGTHAPLPSSVLIMYGKAGPWGGEEFCLRQWFPGSPEK